MSFPVDVDNVSLASQYVLQHKADTSVYEANATLPFPNAPNHFLVLLPFDIPWKGVYTNEASNLSAAIVSG